MTRVFHRFAAACLTPVKLTLAALAVMVVVAASSEESAGSGDPNSWVCCGGPWLPQNPWNPGPFNPGPSTPTTPSATLNLPWITATKVGAPTWKLADFQMFTAPSDTDEAFRHTLTQLLPLEGPNAPVPYTPHAGPYDVELSTNAAAAGFVNKQVFARNAITLNPNAVWLAFMMLPDPGVTGSSRDFASGPIIPNSLFPFSTHSEIFLNNVSVETLQDGTFSPRNGDLPFDGASHRGPGQAVWHPWANDPNVGPEGNYEIRWSLRDNTQAGWDIVAPFQVTPEPSSMAISAFAVAGLAAVRRRLNSLV